MQQMIEELNKKEEEDNRSKDKEMRWLCFKFVDLKTIIDQVEEK
jgi:hypothetical protein